MENYNKFWSARLQEAVAEIEARVRAETEARVRAETEARVRAETEARVRAEYQEKQARADEKNAELEKRLRISEARILELSAVSERKNG